MIAFFSHSFIALSLYINCHHASASVSESMSRQPSPNFSPLLTYSLKPKKHARTLSLSPWNFLTISGLLLLLPQYSTYNTVSHAFFFQTQRFCRIPSFTFFLNFPQLVSYFLWNFWKMTTLKLFALPIISLMLMAISYMGQAQDSSLSPASAPASDGESNYRVSFHFLNIFLGLS